MKREAIDILRAHLAWHAVPLGPHADPAHHMMKQLDAARQAEGEEREFEGVEIEEASDGTWYAKRESDEDVEFYLSTGSWTNKTMQDESYFPTRAALVAALEKWEEGEKEKPTLAALAIRKLNEVKAALACPGDREVLEWARKVMADRDDLQSRLAAIRTNLRTLV
jgi:hypothetical protein